MSLRLRLASLWMPQFMVAREIDAIRSSTDAALYALLREHVPGAHVEEVEEKGRGVHERRAAMARGHERKVRILIEGLGRERAIPLGRDALFRTGMGLGKEAKARLGVKDTKDDLVRAAKVLYHILGIELIVVAGPNGERMEVTRCALAPHYSPETCAILSAVDEGAVSGINQGARMIFREHITDGYPRCLATIEFREER